MSFQPFSGNSSHDVFRNHIDKVIEEIMSLSPDYILKSSITELEEYYKNQAIIDPIIIDFDNRYIEGSEGIKVEVKDSIRRNIWPGETALIQGTKIKIAIPYNGDHNLWNVQPSTHYLSGYPKIEDKSDRVLVEFIFTDDDVNSDRLKERIDHELQLLCNMITNLQNDVEKHNAQVERRVTEALHRRKDICLTTTNAIDSIGIPIKRLNQPLTYNIPVTRRKVNIYKPQVTHDKYEPEPVLAEEEYQNILNIIGSMSLVIERSPKSFSTLDEEGIRTHFLIQLNGHYEGGATGETFNASGKTDILIRVENKNVFIAECKFWRGKKSFDEAVTQLLNYLSWRDSKCALIIFNKNQDTTSVQEKMHEIMSSRKEFRKHLKNSKDNGERYIFIKESDPGREINITTMLFDFPVE